MRGRGEGTIYQRRSDGRWQAAFTTGYNTIGNPTRKNLYGATRTEVHRKLTKALRERDQGLPASDERQTVGAFLSQWLAGRTNLRAKTAQSYRELIEGHLIPGIGKKALTKLSPYDVQGFLQAKTKAGYSARTVEYLRAILRAALNTAMAWELIQRNAAALADPPKRESADIHPFTAEEARRFLEAIRGHRLEALFSVTLALGLRKGEALGLGLQDVDLEARVVTVRRSLQRVQIGDEPSRLELSEVKTDRSRRRIPLPKFVVEVLRGHLQRRARERLQARGRWEESGLMFCTPIGTPIDPRNALAEFHQALKAAKLPRRSFHSLRHSCATLLLNQGVSARTIMEILGHSSIRVTMDAYAHVFPAIQQEAMAEMHRILKLPAVKPAVRVAAKARK
jgi:integrase